MTTRWTGYEVSLYLRMYPHDAQKRRSIADRLAVEYPIIARDIGRQNARIVRSWLAANGVSVSDDENTTPPNNTWGEIWRLFKLWIGIKWRGVRNG